MTKPQAPLHPAMLLVTLFCAEVLAAFELSMLYPALKPMIVQYGNAEAVGWVMTSFFLSSAVFAALCGRLGDLLGRRRLLQVVIVLSIIGSLISAFSSGLAGLIFGRVIQGASGAIFALCLGLVRQHAKPASVPMMIGILAATLTVTMGLGIYAGGLIVDNLGWRWIFYGGAIAGVIALVAVSFTLPIEPYIPLARLRAINLTGGVLFAPAVVLLLLAFTKAPGWGWLSFNTLAALVAAGLLLVAWIQSELRAKMPLLDVRLLLDRQVLLVNLGSVMLGLTSFQSLQLWSIVLQQPTETGVGLGASASLSGLVLLPKTLVALISGPTAGWLIARYSGRVSLVFGSVIMVAMWTTLLFQHGSILAVGIFLTLMGYGMSTYYASIPILITRVAPAQQTSEAAGMMIVIRATAMGIGAQLVAVIMNSSTVSYQGASYPDETALTRVLVYVICGALLQIVIALFLKDSKTANSTAQSVHSH